MIKKIFFILCFICSSLIDNDVVCKKYLKKKSVFNLEEFKNIYNKENINKKKEVYVDYSYKENKDVLKYIFEPFEMEKKGRKPIILFNEEILEKRKKEFFALNNKKLNLKIEKMYKLLSKTIKYIENLLLIYSKPIKNFEFDINWNSLNFAALDDLFKGDESIWIKEFDYYLFIDFENNQDENYTAYNISNFSFLKYHSRPILGYLKINLHYLSEADVKYEEIITLVHEFLHSFGLIDKKLVGEIMDKFISLDKNNKIKQYIEKNNDFYNLYNYLKNNDLLNKLYNKKNNHFNPNFLFNDIMQPSKVYLKNFTYISKGLFEILTNYEIRINEIFIKKNYDTCLPIWKSLFKNDCNESKSNFIKSFNWKNEIKLNNKCSKLENEVTNNFCNSTYQFKRYCNYFSNNINNLSCYQSISSKKSNCFDDSNNNEIIKDSFDYNIKQHYGIKSNCFEILNLTYNKEPINPVCFKNDIDIKNSRIKIYIQEKIELYCKYKIKFNKELKENFYEKLDDFIEFKYNETNYKLYCPDMNKFYKNNISNLCDNDCYLNGQCIGLNKCQCFNGFDPETNCKEKIKGFKSMKNMYIFNYPDKDENDDKDKKPKNDDIDKKPKNDDKDKKPKNDDNKDKKPKNDNKDKKPKNDDDNKDKKPKNDDIDKKPKNDDIDKKPKNDDKDKKPKNDDNKDKKPKNDNKDKKPKNDDDNKDKKPKNDDIDKKPKNDITKQFKIKVCLEKMKKKFNKKIYNICKKKNIDNMFKIINKNCSFFKVINSKNLCIKNRKSNYLNYYNNNCSKKSKNKKIKNFKKYCKSNYNKKIYNLNQYNFNNKVIKNKKFNFKFRGFNKLLNFWKNLTSKFNSSLKNKNNNKYIANYNFNKNSNYQNLNKFNNNRFRFNINRKKFNNNRFRFNNNRSKFNNNRFRFNINRKKFNNNRFRFNNNRSKFNNNRFRFNNNRNKFNNKGFNFN